MHRLREILKMKANNLVAKHARNFNKASVQRDRKNDYRRNDKHRNRTYN